MNTFSAYLARFLVILFILPAHEFAHAFAAHKNGDDTAKNSGRYTLNPLKHFDLIGLICFIILGVGWAKPVPVNPYNFKDYKKGCFWVSISGVLTNYVLAFLFWPLYLLVSTYLSLSVPEFIYVLIVTAFFWGFALNLSLCIFNLIPVYPLDGFRLLDVFIKKRGPIYNFLRKYGYYALIGIILFSSILSNILNFNIFTKLMNFSINVIGYPIRKFWQLIFSLFLG